jgi:uncharacterized integral membrane protein (TIGR00698 family)
MFLKSEFTSNIKGVSLSIIVSIVALGFSSFLPIGVVALSIITGIVIANIIKFDKSYNSGITYSEKSILAFAITTLGINLDFSFLMSLGFQTLVLIILAMVVTIFSGIILGKIFNIDKKFALLLGIGNGVCGASAIGAVKGVIDPKDEYVGISVAVVNILGTIGIFLLPAIALFFNLNDLNSGILVGNTLQAVGQAVASGFSISDEVGQSATIVKMTRVLLLSPILLILLFSCHKQNNEDTINKLHIFKNIPIFIYGFIFFSILSSTGILPSNIKNIISHISHYALIIAMAGVGLKITFSSIKQNGKIALIIGSIIFFIQISFSLVFIRFILT